MTSLGRFKFVWNQLDSGWVSENGDVSMALGDDDGSGWFGRPRSGAYLFDLTADPSEAMNLLWSLPTLTDEEKIEEVGGGGTALSAPEVEQVAVHMTKAFCTYYDAMVGAFCNSGCAHLLSGCA